METNDQDVAFRKVRCTAPPSGLSERPYIKFTNVKDAVQCKDGIKKCMVITREHVYNEGAKEQIHLVEDDKWSVCLNGEYSYMDSNDEDACKSYLIVMKEYGYTIVKMINKKWYKQNLDDEGYLPQGFGRNYCLPITSIKENRGDLVIRTGYEKYNYKRFKNSPYVRVRHMMERRVCRYVELKCKIDQEYVKGEMKVEEIKLPEAVEDKVDEEVYQRYKRVMNIKMVERTERCLSGHPTLKMQDVCGYQLYKVYRAWKGELFLNWKDIDGGFSYGAKPANIKKDGTRRIVYPMSPKLNAYITQNFGDMEPVLPKNVRMVKRLEDWKKFKYSYDVESCDRYSLPYFKRLIREEAPDAFDKIFSGVMINGVKHELTSFPSGICKFMKVQSVAYTIARYNLGDYKSEVQIQGDGFAMTEPLKDTSGVREFDMNVINGFRIVGDGEYRYVNGMEKLTTPVILRRKNQLRGSELWHFRRRIYQLVLNAEELPEARDNKLKERFEKMSVHQLMEYCRLRDEHQYEMISHVTGMKEKERDATGFGGWDTKGYV